MKIKIGDKIIDSNNEPIAIKIDDRFIEVINNMGEGHTIFLAYPSEFDSEDMRGWAKELKD